MEKVNIGLDIGITSVGWAILDKDFSIKKHGVRLFEMMEDGKSGKLNNVKRREMRSLRRQKNRKITLKNDFIKWLKTQKWIDLEIDKQGKFRYEFVKDYIQFNSKDVLDIRLKSLKEKISKVDLIKMLYWYLTLRGYKYTEISEDKDDYKEIKDIQKKLNISSEKFKNLLPCQIQKEYFIKNGFYRSHLNRIIHTDKYAKELKAIFTTQKISESFQIEFLEKFFYRQRSYEEGPLSASAVKKIKDQTSLSKYSRFIYDEKTKQLKTYQNMWENKIGKCSYYKNENRINKNTFTAEIFNLLNDLNNIYWGDKSDKQKLAKEEKLAIINLSLKNKKNVNKAIKYIFEKHGVEKEEIKGFRINASKAPLLSELSSFNYLKKIDPLLISAEKILDNDFINQEINKIDQIINALSRGKSFQKRLENLSELEKELKWNLNENKEKIANIKASFSQTHRLSQKLIQQLLPELLNGSRNQMEIIHEMKQNADDGITAFKNTKYVPSDWIDDEDFIASPTTKRALRQSIKVINNILKSYKHFKIDNIVIEMARDLNGKDKKDSVRSLQRYLEERKKSIKDQIEAVEQSTGIKASGRTLLKLWLYEQQNGKDAYTNEDLNKNDVITKPSYTDIDHIIPYSFCFDDSQNNKVLTLSRTNAAKGNRQPNKFLSKENFNKMFDTWADWYSPKNNQGASRKAFANIKKFENLVSNIDYSDPANAYGFIGRNIVDTRYVTKKLYVTLNEFIQNLPEAAQLFQTKLKTINGKMTNFIRKMVEQKSMLLRPDGLQDGSFDEKTGKKERGWNGHHAEDAVFVVHAALKNNQLNKYIEKVISNPFMSEKESIQFAGKAIGKNWNEDNKDKLLDFDFIRKSLNNNYEKVSFSYMLNKRQNQNLFNETTYRGIISRENSQKIRKYEKNKISDLVNSKEKLKKIFEEDKYDIPMKKYDPKTWEILKDAYLSSDTQKPFEDKLDEKGRFIIENQKDEKVSKRFIKNINILKEEKNIDGIVIITNPDNKNIGFKESLEWLAIELFQDEKGKNKLLPLTTKNIKFGKKCENPQSQETFCYKDFYWKQLKEKDLKLENKKATLYYGSIIEDLEGNRYRVNGHQAKLDQLELKKLFSSKPSKDRYYAINTKIKKWEIIEVNSLGQKIKKIAFF